MKELQGIIISIGLFEYYNLHTHIINLYANFIEENSEFNSFIEMEQYINGKIMHKIKLKIM